jgi:Tol biopolymer transport system component
MMSLSIGARLGPYEIISQLGAGGMGEVYRARDTRLDRTVAIKILPRHLSDNIELRQRFEREAHAASALNHPNVCTIHDIGHQDGIDFLVMELIEGETLSERLKKGTLPTDQVLRYAVQIANALDKAHRAGIVHRDLKPGNIMLTRAGAKLLDFGLAKLRGNNSKIAPSLTSLPTERVSITAEGAILGTFQYMAPEQLEGGDADARTDIFAFGAVVYEMATGKRAFTGASQASLITAIMSVDPPPISEHQPMSPPALNRIVKRCLAKDPDERWQTAHDLMEELKWVAEAGSEAGVPAPVVARRKIRERVWIIAAVLFFLIALGLALAYFRRTQPDVRAIRFTIPAPENRSALGPVISPDGRRIAYISGARGAPAKRIIWIHSLDSVSAQPLPGTENVTNFGLFWSPDSRFIGFSADDKLKKIDLSTGHTQTLADAPGYRGGTWNRDGVIVFAENQTPLQSVPASGGLPAPVTALDGSRQEISHRFPFFLPDGRHFLYLGRSSQKENTGIYVGSLESKETHRLVSADSMGVYASSGYLLFTRDLILMAQPFDASSLKGTSEAFPIAERIRYDSGSGFAQFSASENGVLVYLSGAIPSAQLTWLDREGKKIAEVGQPGSFQQIRLSPDNKRAAVQLIDPQTATPDIWVIDIARGSSSRFTFDPAFDAVPQWSSDGSRIAFSSDREGQMNIYQKLSSGAGGEEEVFKSSERKILNDWSSDGRFIAYHVLAGSTKSDIWILPLLGDRKPYPFLQTKFGELQAQFSPDARWIAYVSDESGNQEVYVQSFPVSSGKWKVSTGGGNQPRWSSDGNELFYNVFEKYMAVEVKTAGQSFEAGVPKLLFEIRGSAWDVSADGKRFLIAVPVEERNAPPVTVVLNWTADLKR